MGCEGGYAARRPWLGQYFEVVRRGLTARLGGASFPGRVVKAFDEYLRCGNPAFGLSQVKCNACGKSMAVAFSCKGPVCPSCTNRRAEEAAFQWEEGLPLADYRMWTLSLPRGLRFLAVKRKPVFLALQRGLVQAVGRWQRERQKRYFKGRELKSGALVFVQWFGSALQLTPHFHVLVPEALWTREGYETLQVEAIQERLPLAGEEIELPKTRKPMVAVWG